MGSAKPLIVPWLREKLDRGLYPGVNWLDEAHTQFRVPWKHGLRQDASSEDFQLFRDWAIDSGCYRPGIDVPAPSVWKRNFRSALNRKPGIRVLQDHSSDSADPHKVYEILPDGVQAGAPEVPAAAMGGTMAEVSSHCLDRLEDSTSCNQDDELDAILNTLNLSSPEEDVVCPAFRPVPPCVTDGATGGDFLPLVQPTTNPVESLLRSKVLTTDFEVQVYYRGHLVLKTLISNTQGFRLVPSNPSPSPCPELIDVILPDAGSLLDQVQASYTAKLLQGLGAGVLLRTEGPTLYAGRRGRLHAYWGRTETPLPGAEGGELPKEGYAHLYDLQRFIRELICFMEGQGGSPIYELWLCLGEAWPDMERSWKKKLIMVQVVPTAMRILHQLSQAGGASSLHSEELDLRISDSLGEASLLEVLREWEERMETEPYS